MSNYTYQHDPRISGADFEDDYDPDDDCRTHTLSCECEDCMQTYPERFDEDWNNIHWCHKEQQTKKAAATHAQWETDEREAGY